jgi:hypothetical protein
MNTRILVFVMILGLLAPPRESRAETNLVFSQDYLAEVMRYLYRWHLDETALLTIDNASDIEILVRSVTPKLDEGDGSQFCELLVPQLSFLLILKKADYEVPEMSLRIENREFRVLRAEKYENLPAPRESYEAIRLPKKEILAYLYATRNKSEYPDPAMRERMRRALREQLNATGIVGRAEAQTYYIAPISRVSNDLWVFWESGGKIIRFSSDTDLLSKAYWEYEKLGVHVYDLREHVVVSLAEVPGSNAYVTRDWAARVLFNCVVFGQRLTIVPEANLDKPVTVRESPVTGTPDGKRETGSGE